MKKEPKEPKKTQHIKGSNEDLLAQNELLRMEVAYLKKLQALILEKRSYRKRESANNL